MKLIVGLGNPGRIYAHNRHNVGYRCLNYFAKLHSIRFDHRQCWARVGAARIESEQLLLAKPVAFMNLSGRPVACLVSRHGIPLSNLLIIYDDMDLPVGRIRLRKSGSSGGHKGMDSIIGALGSQAFSRMRVGIGRPDGVEKTVSEDTVVNYVLSDFSPQEEAMIKPVITKVAEVINFLLSEGMDAAMGKFN